MNLSISASVSDRKRVAHDRAARVWRNASDRSGSQSSDMIADGNAEKACATLGPYRDPYASEA
jgi:hypothetical protein